MASSKRARNSRLTIRRPKTIVEKMLDFGQLKAGRKNV